MNGHGGNTDDFGISGLIDFSSNINPFGPPDYALLAARESLALINRYPDARQTGIRRAFSAWLSVDVEKLVFGNGASDLIPAIFSALSPSRVIVTYPTFSEYEFRARSIGLPVLGVPSDPMREFDFDINGIEKILSRGDLLVMCQPNNPTGAAWKEEDISRLSEACDRVGGYLLADECFINLSHPPLPSCIPLTERRNTVVLRAVTKDFSAPGLRVGFAISHPDVARGIRENLQTWPLNCAGEAFAAACAGSPEPFLETSARKIAALREKLFLGLRGLGFVPNAGRANFLLVRSDLESAERIFERALKCSVLIRKCGNFPILDGRYFRVAVKLARDNASLLSVLASLVDN
ncbi:MAG: aminotransferase class I/II-fold pyridoxal phosphate-dependent enzyme [Synergistaceae bacterium]|jgi:threonine-phosphate decarboxylase|nr:aminotransferase class I/II-fold pyridoxal phosphate-dependent enzyme [Synergistaceae bacterium]